MTAAVEVRWQTGIKSLSEGIQHLFRTKEFADVTFFVQGKPFKAHKLVLASRSLELTRQLMTPNASDEIVVPSTITVKGFQAFLSFVYTNELNTSDKKSIVEAYKCGKYYEQKALQKKCLSEIESWDIDAEDACELLGMDCDITLLREKCIAFVRNNGRRVIASEAFVKSSSETVLAILASDALADVPALQRIDSIMNWGKHHFLDSEYSACVRKLLLDADPPLMGKLGIRNLKIEDFIKLPKYPNLLTDEEIRQFLMYYSSQSSNLPSWCTLKE